MRISDWSSDVCSSDLRDKSFCIDALRAPSHIPPPLREWREASGQQDEDLFSQAGGHRAQMVPDRRRGPGARQARVARRDRKSVVSGKSVSVRVSLGGCRVVKKKNIIETQNKE